MCMTNLCVSVYLFVLFCFCFVCFCFWHVHSLFINVCISRKPNKGDKEAYDNQAFDSVELRKYSALNYDT